MLVKIFAVLAIIRFVNDRHKSLNKQSDLEITITQISKSQVLKGEIHVYVERNSIFQDMVLRC